MIDIEIEDDAWLKAAPDAAAVTRRAALAAHEGAYTILLTDDDTVRDLSAQFRDKPVPTNVLSFPAAPNPEEYLGDIALAFGVCAREAGEQGKSLADHLSHLVIHGVLHLLGYDHQDEAEAEQMEDIERKLLAKLDIKDPYSTPSDAIAPQVVDRGKHVQHSQ